MDVLLRRLALALLSGFATLVLAVPVGCGALMLYSEHVNGDVQTGGPSALLGGMALAGMLALMVAVLVFWKSGGSGD